MANTPEEWFAAIPKVSRYWMLAVLATLFLTAVGIVPIGHLLLSWEHIRAFQIWRIVTPFFVFGKPGFSFLIFMLILAKYGAELERAPYPSGGGNGTGNSADFLFMLMFGAVILLILGSFLSIFYLGPSLAFMVVYVWSRRNATASVSLWGFGPFLGVYLPWLYVVFAIILGDNPLLSLMGIGAGHLYYFLQVVLPENAQYGYRLLKTPQFLTDLVEGRRVNAANPVIQPRAFQGQGRVLGQQ